jgi:alpha-glucosidase (family GH31 glycosyl hydrolase)
MVPGRVQTMNADDALPSDELMLRWTECSAFFPCLQFSYFPWNYAEVTAKAVAGFAKVHKALEGYLSGQAADRKAPLLRPLWYDSPEHGEFYTIDDSFLLGSDLLVAPVLDAGIRARDIQLPPGEWIDAWTGETQTGYLKDWPAPCPGVPLFVKAQNTTLLSSLQSALVEIERGNAPVGTTATWEAGLNRDLSVTG